jgi:hypothetical protein
MLLMLLFLLLQVLSDTVQGRTASDVVTLRDCTVFLDFPVSMAMTEVPTKKFTFRCIRPVEDRRPVLRDPIQFMMSRSTSLYVHLPPPRARTVMTARDVLYNDLREYLTTQKVGFNDDLAHSLGDEFLKNLSSALFPLSKSVWKAINDKHNRRGPAPDPEFAAFFGRKILGHKADRPCMPTVVQHLQDLWLGMGKTLKYGVNWLAVSLKIQKQDPPGQVHSWIGKVR